MPSQQNRGPELLGVQAAFLAAAWIATCLRLYVKTTLTKSHTVDDGVMYLSTVLYSVYAAVAVHGIVNGGIGRHTSDLDPGSIVIALKVWYTCEILYAFISALIRTSICLFLLRIFNRGTNKLAKKMLQANIALVWVSSLIYLFIVVFQCNPPNYYWAKFEGLQGSCRPAHLVPNATVAHSVIAALSDWVIGILPMWILWQLQMKREKKIRLLCFFGIGVIAGIIMIIRIPYIKVLEISADFLYQTVDVALWSLLEPSIGIVAGCIATLRPLIATCATSTRPRKRSTSSWRRTIPAPHAILVTKEVEITVETGDERPLKPGRPLPDW
ncbi:hypothetical protein BDP55DRAFT_683816 [Colletotrichum godetiae]|uniref:Rhodopsin domain-containing protein n=1 Tax=Colletotrichum godetiae TaxID=1209918 RepID=A0AAJ0ER07_9PEZI|nr:uncharacterized protein BDP55DRAFT_683816 [Colletotrichum godetiae]KAK1658099.1 hypothetical protein BDP55DRAFT_683816 [Colletotrichum godetiae]